MVPDLVHSSGLTSSRPLFHVIFFFCHRNTYNESIKQNTRTKERIKGKSNFCDLAQFCSEIPKSQNIRENVIHYIFLILGKEAGACLQGNQVTHLESGENHTGPC